MVKKILFILLINGSLGYAQVETPKPKKPLIFAFSPGIIQQRNTLAEANLFIGRLTNDYHPKVPYVGVSGIRIGVESDFNKTIAPKIGYEFALVGWAMRLSAINYYQNDQSEFRLLPEIGFSMGGWANLTYGYGISFHDKTITDIGHHRVSLSFNLNKRLNKAVFKHAEPTQN